MNVQYMNKVGDQWRIVADLVECYAVETRGVV